MFSNSNFTTGFIYILIGLTAFIDVSNSAKTLFNVTVLMRERLSQRTKYGLWTQHDYSTTPTCDRKEKTQNSQCSFLRTGLMVNVCCENHTTHLTAL